MQLETRTIKIKSEMVATRKHLGSWFRRLLTTFADYYSLGANEMFISSANPRHSRNLIYNGNFASTRSGRRQQAFFPELKAHFHWDYFRSFFRLALCDFRSQKNANEVF